MFIKNDSQISYPHVSGDACCSFIAPILASVFQSRPDGRGAAGKVRSQCKEYYLVESCLAWSCVECARNVKEFLSKSRVLLPI